MPKKQYSIVYPRRVILRFFLRILGRFLLGLLTRSTVNGAENLPKSGPVILVGNHVAMMETLLMALLVPWTVEFIATGDIPIDPRFAWLVHLYGIIPVNRGRTDRNEMQRPLDVLKQNGVVGIFPEGGIWSTDKKQARTGVAWLSFHSQAPVIPMGFGGMRGALQAAFMLRRPRLVMNIGKMLPPVQGTVPGKSRKQALEDGANEIMTAIEVLVPPEEKRDWNQIQDEHFEFGYQVGDDPQEHTPTHALGLGRFFHTPVILDVMARNLNLPVEPLQCFDETHDAQVIADALGVALQFLDDHPQFLSYRFGYKMAREIYDGVVELRDIAQAAADQGQSLTLKPVRRYFDALNQQTVVQTRPGQMHEM